MATRMIVNDPTIVEKNRDKKVIIDFYAVWCGPCKMLAPIYEAVAQEFVSDAVVFGRVDIDQEKNFAAKYQVKSIPTIIIFANGQEINRHTGYLNKKHLIRFINS